MAAKPPIPEQILKMLQSGAIQAPGPHGGVDGLPTPGAMPPVEDELGLGGTDIPEGQGWTGGHSPTPPVDRGGGVDLGTTEHGPHGGELSIPDDDQIPFNNPGAAPGGGMPPPGMEEPPMDPFGPMGGRRKPSPQMQSWAPFFAG